MRWRLFHLMVYQLLGALLGNWLADVAGAAAGIALSSIVWCALDTTRGVRLMTALRRRSTWSRLTVRGWWNELAHRIDQQFKTRDAQINQSQARLQEFLAAIQASPNGVILLDPQNRIEWCNQTGATLLGLEMPRDVMQYIVNLVRDPVFVQYLAAGVEASNQAVALESPSSTPTHPVRLSIQRHPYGQGRQLLLARDVTLIEQAQAMRRDFVANVSHEIKTPLTVVLGFIETLQTLPLDEAQRTQALQVMAQQAQRMHTLVADLLTLSQLEGSPEPSQHQWHHVQGLMRQCQSDAQALLQTLGATSRTLHFEWGLEADIAGSHSELLSALSNLVNNAVRYTSGDITVRWQVLPDGHGEFTVQDQGPGIPAEHIGRLTERFYRIDQSRSRETGGTGLGLAIVKHVAQRHGGELDIQSTLGVGSTFRLTLAAARARLR